MTHFCLCEILKILADLCDFFGIASDNPALYLQILAELPSRCLDFTKIAGSEHKFHSCGPMRLWSVGVGFPSVCFEYFLLQVANKEVALFYGRVEYRKSEI